MNRDYNEQFAFLRDYCEELLRSNPGSTVKIDVEPESNPNSETREFRRIYICFAALKAGFKMCGREILGLGGCFMKGSFPGKILTAVGADSNNFIYPVAFAIVEAETYNSWTWFLECLAVDLDLTCNTNFTFISDMQKGLTHALSKVFPRAEHRYCLTHIYGNMKKQWRGKLFKDILWKCASATTIPQFNKAMEEIRQHDHRLFDWLKQIPPASWSRAHFTGRAKCDMLVNNLCKLFNKQLDWVRDKHVITCLDYIRVYMMKRIVIVQKMIAESDGPLTPTATKTFNAIKHEASPYKVLSAGNKKYQVSGPRGVMGDQCVVDMELNTCSCRKWELTGMPCKHAVAVIWDMARDDTGIGMPENWVSEVYWLDTWKNMYMKTIDLISGRDYWIPSSCPTKLMDPRPHLQIERPTKMRKKSTEEIQES